MKINSPQGLREVKFKVLQKKSSQGTVRKRNGKLWGNFGTVMTDFSN